VHAAPCHRRHVGADNNREFLTKAMDASTAEVELGRLAQQKAASADVKRVARRW